MALTMATKFCFFSLIFLLGIHLPHVASSSAEKQVYIVYFGGHSGDRTLEEIEENHHSYLFSLKKNEEEAKASLIYSYKHGINGFAAVLSPHEASKLSEMEEVVSVYRSYPRKYSTHTTRSWEFVGLDEKSKWKHTKSDDLLFQARYGKDVIVGVLDSGVWPESKSFSDKKMGPIPKSWNGICQSGDSFNSSHCNKKLIGARYYIKGYENYYGPLNTTLDSRSPRDKDGHGTHTASTAAGRRIRKVSALGGFAHGTASGGSPLARLAIYKVCWAIPGQGKEDGNTCFEEDMLAAIDDAIADGVDVLSISIGTRDPVPFTEDAIGIGSLHAVKKNIVVSCSAGNSGPAPSTLSNPSPWIITVGASSVDRAFIAPVKLGNGLKLEGQTATPDSLKKKMYPLVYAAQVVNSDVSKSTTGQCLPGSLSPAKTNGKIVLCLRGEGTRVGKGLEVKRAGGAGFILGNSPANGADLAVDAHLLPATAVNSEDAIRILNYINSTENPIAYIHKAKTVIHKKPAPFMSAFSSRGPSTTFPHVLKPDITAPGLNILAAWSEASSPSKLEVDKRVAKYNIISGTSMSCPHVSGAAALLKAVHPDWSSAAIRSALMTSAGVTNNKGKPITDGSGTDPADPFQLGSGHLQPSNAAEPGLVYDASYHDYLLFLCSSGVNNTVDPSFKCPRSPPPAYTLNYPSLAIPDFRHQVTVRRRVRNVGYRDSMYFARVYSPPGFTMKIMPAVLGFDLVGDEKSFKIHIKAERGISAAAAEKGKYAFGWYTWEDGNGIYKVRSPIAISLA